MNTIPAQEIKRRGIIAVDAALKKGAVHIIKNNQPQYVVLSEEQYKLLRQAFHQAFVKGVRASQHQAKSGKVHKFNNVDDIMKLLDDEDS